MKKLFFTLLLLIGISSITFLFLGQQKTLPSISGSGKILENPIIMEQANTEISSQEKLRKTKLENQEIVRKKIETIKKRLALKGLIIEGDDFYREDKLLLALRKYLDFYKKNPEDILILRKIGNTYFSMHKYTSAFNYYSKIGSPGEKDLNNIIRSLFYSTDFSQQEDILKLQNSLQTLDLSPSIDFYYTTSLECRNDFHNCKSAFGEYFWPKSSEDNLEKGEIKQLSSELLKIKNSIETYRNFQLDQVYLKDAYMIGAWYENGLYPLTIYLGEQLLETKKDYKPILKIVAQSYFELGKYEKARETLGKYYELDNTDPAVAYLLGVVNTKLREYILANIYFSKALNLFYKPQIDIHRYMVRNFYTLGSDKNMIQAFARLINDNDDFNENDLGLAIYYHIIQGKYNIALQWSKKGQELFTKSVNFYAYQGWILREQGNLEEAEQILQKGLNIDKENPFLLINIAYNYLGLGKTQDAFDSFKKVLKYSSTGNEFYKQAVEELDSFESSNYTEDSE